MRLGGAVFHLLLLLCQYSRSFTVPTHPRPFSCLTAIPGADIEQEVDEEKPQRVGDTELYRGKVNEVDYCIAPADVSLSRAYDQSGGDKNGYSPTTPTAKTLSLTQYLNNASNRAVRRVLLVRCWPSEEALNLSLRLAAEAEKQARKAREASGSTARCPVPRPILNLLMRRDSSAASKGRTTEQYVADQIQSFKGTYGTVPGYEFAEAYLDCVLSLAKDGVESPSVKEVMEAGVYDESYKRVLAVLKSVGGVVENIPGSRDTRIAKQLVDQEFCLSMIDKLQIQREAAPDVLKPEKVEKEILQVVEKAGEDIYEKKRRLKFWKESDSLPKDLDATDDDAAQKEKVSPGNVILASTAPTMTRQLNALSNIVQRALLFGGDQELLVLSETLASNRAPFAERWYPNSGKTSEDMEEETRPGLQYLNALVLLLRKAYDEGVVSNLEPEILLIQSYSNAYDRLMGSLVELGSGYVRIAGSDVMSMPKPRSATEELGRFAVWESNFRSVGGESTRYPDDLVGSWEVKDEVGGETIGISTVTFEPQGEVSVAPPLQGLRWRLDPGPTHLDTCTFQVLSEDGTVLQYRGFIDRGARLEARFSRRATRIRGSVMFQMRDGDIVSMGEDYWRDMLPINYKTGTTKFVMTKK